MLLNDLSKNAGLSTRIVTVAIILLTIQPAPALSQAVRFGHLTKSAGLSNMTVEAVVEDQQGFLWFGTPDGLNRYDGYTFKIYRFDPDNPQSLSQNQIQALLVDRSGALWIGTWGGGLNRYDPATDTFVRYRHADDDPGSISNNFVISLYKDRQGDLWAGTYGGANHFDAASGAFNHFTVDAANAERGLSTPNVHVMLEDRAGDLWFGTDRGLDHLDRRTGSVVHYLHDYHDPGSISNSNIWALREDRDGTLWVGTHGGLNRFDRKTRTFSHFRHEQGNPYSLSSDHVTRLMEDRNGTLWVGTDGGGLNRFDRVTGRFYSYRHSPYDAASLSSNVVRSIFEDYEGDLWIGTNTGGINIYNRRNAAFAYYRNRPDDPFSLSNSGVLSFLEDSDGTLWVGTEGGLNRFSPVSGRFRAYRHDPHNSHSLSADAVLSLLKDRHGNFWVGTYFGGLNRFDEDRGSFEHIPFDKDGSNGLSGPHVWDLLEDHEGQLWIATFDGLNRYDYDTGQFTHYHHDPNDAGSLANDVVWSLYEDAGGTLWIATQDGLSRYDRAGDRFRTYRHDEADSTSLSASQIYVMTEDQEGRFWLGTAGGGLNRFDRTTETFTAFRTRDGLPNNVINGLLEDDRGRLWISTNEGISAFNPDAGSVVNYDRSDGILAGPFTKKAYLKSHSGALYFGGINGYTRFSPDSVRANSAIPPVVLTDFQIFNKPVRFGGEKDPLRHPITEAKQIRLQYDQSVITFGFAALNFRAPEKNAYAYRLSPFDADWQYVGTRRTATYTNLDPGRYIFHVKGSNNSGLWNETGTSIEVVIKPPYWATWWFRLLGFVGLVGITFWAFRTRTHSIRARNQTLQSEIDERRRIERERKKLLARFEGQNVTLEIQNEELERKNAELERFTYTVSHDLKSPLVTIKGFLGLLETDLSRGDIERVRDDMTRIGNAADKMAQLLRELLELSRIGRLINPPEQVPLAEILQEALTLVGGQMDACGAEVVLPSAFPSVFGDRMRLLEVWQNLLDNAAKFMGNQPMPRVEIRAEELDREVRCLVRDNGTGIDPKYQDMVFGLFNRLDTGTDGTGIGLALVKRIVEFHGGRIWVESEGLGHGCTFFFTLPRYVPDM